MKKIRPIKKTWYNWLINYIFQPVTKIVGGFKDKIVSLFNISTPKQTVYATGKKLSKPKALKQSEENKNNSIRKKKKKKKRNCRWSN